MSWEVREARLIQITSQTPIEYGIYFLLMKSEFLKMLVFKKGPPTLDILCDLK